MKRKIISIILVVSMTVAFVPSFAFATDQDGGDQLETPETDAETVVEEELEPETSTTAVDEGEGDPANENKTDKSDSSLEGTESTNSLLTNDKNKNQKSASGDEKVSISKDSQTSIKGYDFKLSEKSFIYNGNVQLPDVLCNTLTRGVDYKVHCFSADFYDYEFWYYYDYDYDYDGDYAYYEDSGGYYYSEQYDCYFDRKPISPGTYYVFIRGVGDYYDVVVLKYKILRTTISLNKTSATLYKKGTLQLKATVKNAVGKTTYSSSNTKVATVSSKGKITAKAKGKATITVKNGLTKKKVKITVKNPYLNFKKASLYVAESKTLKVKGKVGEAKFKSSNKKIATVNKSGEITAKKDGTFNIIVKSNGMTLKCKVTVKKPKLSKKKLTVYNSDKETLKVIGGKGKIKWKTSNSSIATVTSKGKVKGKRAGTCTITAKRGKYTMKCKIKVPSHYAGYSKIPDFGAVYGKTAKERSYEDEGNAVIYKAGKSYYYKYIKLLKRKGFVFYDSTEGVQVYMNDYYDVVGVLYDSGLVAVLYLNLWDTY